MSRRLFPAISKGSDVVATVELLDQINDQVDDFQARLQHQRLLGTWMGLESWFWDHHRIRTRRRIFDRLVHLGNVSFAHAAPNSG